MSELDKDNPSSQTSDIDSLDDGLQVPIETSSNQDLASDNLNKDVISPDISPKPNKSWIWVGLGVFVVLLVGFTIYFVLSRISFNKSSINFTFDPSGVDIIIDGKFNKQSVDSLSIKLKAGDHIIQINKEGYLSFEKEFELVPSEDANMHIELKPIPYIELLAEGSMAFAGLIRNGNTMVYMNNADNTFEAASLDTIATDGNDIELFEGNFTNVEQVIWSPGKPRAIVKIKGFPKLANTYDNRDVRGRFIPLGERPTQGLPRNNGISTWLFDDSRRIAQGWQPILLNESIRGISFAPDENRIIYFYETADGEKSLITAHPDGGEWERLITKIDVVNPTLKWLNNDRYVLLIDDGAASDKLFDVVSKDFQEIMPDRISGTSIENSPDGTRILYLANIDESEKLAVWNIAINSREYIFDESVISYVWQTDENVIVAKTDNTLEKWNLNGRKWPVQFVSSVGDLSPKELFYSRLSKKLFIIEESRILSLDV